MDMNLTGPKIFPIAAKYCGIIRPMGELLLTRPAVSRTREMVEEGTLRSGVRLTHTMKVGSAEATRKRWP